MNTSHTLTKDAANPHIVSTAHGPGRCDWAAIDTVTSEVVAVFFDQAAALEFAGYAHRELPDEYYDDEPGFEHRNAV
jgi:hypothetical protein